jgi:2-aminobenzoate-CoA ligase
MVKIIETYKATICFTSPTAYRAMMAAMDKGADLSSLRLAVSAGETLPAPVFESWTRKTGKPILDGIGSTELLHIFITNRVGDAVAGTTGQAGSGYEAKIVDDDMNELPRARSASSRCAARPAAAISPTTGSRTMCATAGTDRRHLRPRTRRPLLSYGALRRHDRLLRLQHRRPEVEAALLTHPAVAECGVVGAPDEARGMIVKAYVVLAPGVDGRCRAGD